MILPHALRRTLAMTIEAVEGARDPWWIISGAAAALHGVGRIDVGDVDLLLSVRDARALLERIGVAPAINGRTAQFRSTLFARWDVLPLSVDIMADFHVAKEHGWTRIEPRTRVSIEIDGRSAYVPARAELAAMFRVFGRPKDLDRAALLDRRICANAETPRDGHQ